ncbi:MAG TPA: class I SAM-dependent methyltransferase [Candidatus Nanoarchaeia archaeon]|nr:class I SAM-dependent methyltransferase [Candidatus Nanoarchaeia archaeon]
MKPKSPTIPKKISSEQLFINGLLDIQFGFENPSHIQYLKNLSKSVPWAKNWPEDREAFWNAESWGWDYKINPVQRSIITSELKFLNSGCKNLDLGCGSYSYILSVGLDISPKMLDQNSNCYTAVKEDLETKLPFTSNSFDSATAVFVLNYVKKYKGLLAEIKRILCPSGVLMVVLSAIGVNDWQKQKQTTAFSHSEWLKILSTAGFLVNYYRKDNLAFFKCVSEPSPAKNLLKV